MADFNHPGPEDVLKGEIPLNPVGEDMIEPEPTEEVGEGQMIDVDEVADEADGLDRPGAH